MRKKLLVFIILCISAFLMGCGNTDTADISDNGAAEIGSDTTTEETTATVYESWTGDIKVGTKTKNAAEPEGDIHLTGIDQIKEPLLANWEDGIRAVSMYKADLNGDGIDELFVNNMIGAGQYGFTYIYDVSGEPKLLCDIGLRMYFSGGGLYKDDEDKIHFISMEPYSGFLSLSQEDRVYYEINYVNSVVDVKVPFCAKMYDWYDGGLHVFQYKIYTDCGYFSPAVDYRNFDVSDGNLWGIYETSDVGGIEVYNDTSKVSDEIKEIIEQSVFDGLTYVSDIEKFYEQKPITEKGKLKDLTFDEFWESASDAIAEVYAYQL